MRVPTPRRLVGALVAVTLTAGTVVAGTAALAPSRAEAATTEAHGYMLIAGPHLQRGRGHEWMGSYSIDGSPPAYCIDYGRNTPSERGWSTVRSVPGWTTVQAQRVSYVISKWGTTGSNTQAAAANAAINLIIGNPRFVSDWRGSYVPQLARRDRGVVPLANRMVAESASLRGPYKVATAVTHPAAVGATAQVRVVVTSAARKPIPGARVSVRLSNAMPARALPRTTTARGVVAVDVVPSRPGRVAVATTATLPQTGLFRLSEPTSPVVQRLVSAASQTTRAGTTTTFTTNFPRQTLQASLACTGNCAGAPPINVSARNVSARNQLQVFVVVNGKVVPRKVLTLAAGRSGRLSVVVRDGDRVSLAYRWRFGRGWTGFLPYGTAIVVDCPPAAHVDFTVDCPCAGPVTATLRDHNTTRYTHVITVSVPGRANRSVSVPAGRTVALTGLRWNRGQTATVWNQNQLRGKNLGARVKVTTVTFG
jgi:hypothetical protein